MKKLKYILTILIVLFLFTIIKNIIGIDNDFNNPKVEINEEITFQNENEKEKKLDINTVDFEEMVNAGISSKIGYSIIEYRGFVGYIDNLENLTRIKGINKNTLDKLKKIVYIDEMNKKEYMKHNINYLDDTGLFLLGFSKKEIDVINKIRDVKEIKSELDLKGKVNIDIINKYIVF